MIRLSFFTVLLTIRLISIVYHGGIIMNIIEVEHLTKTYGTARGIKDISFHVDEGEIFGFIGPNGAGKSTTIRILMSFIYPMGGSAKYLGKTALNTVRR